MIEDGTVQRIIENSQNYVREKCESYQGAIKQSVISSGFQKSANSQANQYYIEGTTKMQLGNFKDAIDELRKATNLDSSFVEAFDHLGICHRNLNAADSAIFYYEKLKVYFQRNFL